MTPILILGRYTPKTFVDGLQTCLRDMHDKFSHLVSHDSDSYTHLSLVFDLKRFAWIYIDLHRLMLNLCISMHKVKWNRVQCF